MIEVQIAATVHEAGVADNRWVLVDDGDASTLAAAPAVGSSFDAAHPTALTPSTSPPPHRGRAVFFLARWLVLLGALGGAWALSLAIVQSRPAAAASAGTSASQRLDPAPAQADRATREAAVRPAVLQPARLAVVQPSTTQRSKP